jgi:hypothetical protein
MDKHIIIIALLTTYNVNFNLHENEYCLQEAYGTDGPTNSNSVSSPTVFPSASSECIDGPPLSASNYLDSVPTSTVNRITGLKPQDLGTLLAVLGLEKYISKFHTNSLS